MFDIRKPFTAMNDAVQRDLDRAFHAIMDRFDIRKSALRSLIWTTILVGYVAMSATTVRSDSTQSLIGSLLIFFGIWSVASRHRRDDLAAETIGRPSRTDELGPVLSACIPAMKIGVVGMFIWGACAELIPSGPEAFTRHGVITNVIQFFAGSAIFAGFFCQLYLHRTPAEPARKEEVPTI